MGEVMLGAMQQAPQAARQSILAGTFGVGRGVVNVAHRVPVAVSKIGFGT